MDSIKAKSDPLSSSESEQLAENELFMELVELLTVLLSRRRELLEDGSVLLVMEKMWRTDGNWRVKWDLFSF